ncbi:MATE family efflux transporter [uncultured Methanobrevibacter sp.]|uniref:MATE family efflux transporter n=1 Tax=uncultured Methanobrevibacter sp. TaxID=253161 RepID=UPI0025CE742C|nr:MATE family efflux transporter [uncultured Methanobrevibacter sp.]
MYFIILSIVSRTLGIGIFSSGNRIYLLGIMPLTSMCSAFVADVGTQYGSKNMKYLKLAHHYCCIYSVIIGITVAILFITFSNQLVYVFLISVNDIQLFEGISTFIKYTALYIPFL